MAHYSGINLAVYWGSTEVASAELAPHLRTADVAETAPAPESIDVTHKADAYRMIVEGFPGAPETNVTLTAVTDDTWALIDTMALNTQSTLFIYPKGKTAGNVMIRVGPARLHERTYREAYDGTIECTLTFNSKNTALHTSAA